MQFKLSVIDDYRSVDAMPSNDVRAKVASFRFMLAFPVLIAIGLSQAIWGWMGDGTYKRVLYPILCCAMAIVCWKIGRRMLADLGAPGPESNAGSATISSSEPPSRSSDA